jgi:hypothetical protein
MTMNMFRIDQKYFYTGCLLLAILTLSFPGFASTVEAASINDPITATTEGTIFELLVEKEIPANARFVLLGESAMDQVTSEVAMISEAMAFNNAIYGCRQRYRAVEFTIAALEVIPSTRERFIQEGKKLEVKRVKTRRQNGVSLVSISFKHKIIKSITVATTRRADSIFLYNLNTHETSSHGFWDSVGRGLGSLINIGGGNFSIYMPEPETID